ncbi:MAG: hypothetical protein AAGK37_02110 [Pseudomonadota bacterium]
MEYLVWIGAAITVAGVAGLLWCAVAAIRIRNAGLEDAELRTRLSRLVAMNYGALAVATIGLMVVIVGLFLG